VYIATGNWRYLLRTLAVWRPFVSYSFRTGWAHPSGPPCTPASQDGQVRRVHAGPPHPAVLALRRQLAGHAVGGLGCMPATCVHACVRACVHACVRACVRVHACLCVRACLHACVPAWGASTIHPSPPLSPPQRIPGLLPLAPARGQPAAEALGGGQGPVAPTADRALP